MKYLKARSIQYNLQDTDVFIIHDDTYVFTNELRFNTLLFESTANINAQQKFPSVLFVVRPGDGSAGEDRETLPAGLR